MVINGTKDPLVPYDGGTVQILGAKRGSIISTDAIIENWVTFNGCASAPQTASWADTDPKDGCRVHASTWTGGREGTEVVLLRIEGGGHTWPGGQQYLPKAVIGGLCRDFSASKVIWQFFRQHSR